MSRKIECASCHKDMGEIASGSKLRKGLIYHCTPCNDFRDDCIRRFSAQINNSHHTGKYGDAFDDIFGDIFGSKK